MATTTRCRWPLDIEAHRVSRNRRDDIGVTPVGTSSGPSPAWADAAMHHGDPSLSRDLVRTRFPRYRRVSAADLPLTPSNRGRLAGMHARTRSRGGEPKLALPCPRAWLARPRGLLPHAS